ncbi:uncharacterized protein LOC128669914 [Plodia interpunctella]|uniref:uncharacterized protein LOC128669914 n=1 Tax=Plodia interpunctella TaxID=58824 RepID=UPI002368E271|nr:uncharacterized protein LOC128669914 [Plodia interpunctella]
MNFKKQQKITKLFRKGISTRPVEDHDEIQEELKQLERQLKEKQDELFQLQRNSYRCKASPVKKTAESFISPQKIVLNNSVEGMKRELALMSMLTGMEVQSYAVDDHCCIVYHMQHDTKHEVKHGLRIETKSGINEISKSSLPLGFNFNAVMEDFENIMMPDCLGAIRKALQAYYSRLDQFEALKKFVNTDAQLFKILDGSHIEISFLAQNDVEEDEEPVSVVLMLDYRVYDIRPKTFTFKELDLPEGAAVALAEQCTMFKRKPLHKAFKEAFVDGVGPYKMINQAGARESQRRRPQKRWPRAHQHYNNDDTFRPEECSDQSNGADEE